MGVLKSVAIDPATGDLAVPVRLLDGQEAVAQKVQSRWRRFLGEWFLDTREGMPYFRDILGKVNPDLRAIQSTFRKTAANTAGVDSVRSLSLRLDRASRKLFVDVELVTEAGDIISTRDREPFVVDLLEG